MTTIRPPAVAGMFYPAEPTRLQEMVQRFLQTAVTPLHPTPPPKAIIAPHAGYIYSGPIAGSAFHPWLGQMAGVQRIVLIGPAHTMAVRGVVGVSAHSFRTPLGNVSVDQASMERIRPLPFVTLDDEAHTREHGLEVMLPFLQTLAPHCAIVPLLTGSTTGEEVAQLLESLWGGPETRILISSDLSHYYNYATARQLDAATAVAIEKLQPEMVGRESACGRLAIQGLLHLALSGGLHAQTADLRNSGDTAGTKDRVVGYGAFLFT